MDIFYVQGHPFFHTISRKVEFHTVAPVLNRNKAALLREIKPVLTMYKSRGFNIDMEFECIRNDVLPSLPPPPTMSVKWNDQFGQ
jgi:hypothetical protein